MGDKLSVKRIVAAFRWWSSLLGLNTTYKLQATRRVTVSVSNDKILN
jgi:hypothetical protein